MRYFVILFALISLISACSANSVHTSDFERVVKKIKTIDLPFSQECGTDLKQFTFTDDDTTIKKYLPHRYFVAGKIKETDKMVTLLLVLSDGDYEVPYLTTFSHNGNIIEKFELFRSGCGQDEFMTGKAKYVITPDLVINIADSSASYRLDSSGNIITESIKSVVRKYMYRLQEDGKIVPVK